MCSLILVWKSCTKYDLIENFNLIKKMNTLRLNFFKEKNIFYCLSLSTYMR